MTIPAMAGMNRIIIGMVISISIIQSTSSTIEKATIQHKWLFAGYILLLLFTAVMTWLVWRSGNRLQDAVRDEANARIEEAKQGAADALRDAAVANKEAGK